jgi:SAM-dependent methyltransferase
MKPSALAFLCCPECQQSLRLEAERVEDAEVERGWLICSACPTAYPIVRGVPRFVPGDRSSGRDGMVWGNFSRVYLDSVSGTREAERELETCTGWTATAFRGRLVLDVGVGTGRFAEVVAAHGGEVVGVDFNEAVETAHGNLRQFPHVHILQADLAALPFRDETFDLAYAMGVLHHTPGPKVVFSRVSRAVKSAGVLAISLHNRRGIVRHVAPMIRGLTTRLPLGVALVLTAISIPVYYAWRLPFLRRAMPTLCRTAPHRHWRRRWLDAFEWSTATYEWNFPPAEVEGWFRSNGFPSVEVAPEATEVRGMKSPARGPIPLPLREPVDAWRAATAPLPPLGRRTTRRTSW